MTKKSRDANRRLSLRRETMRRLTSLDPADLARVGGGWTTWKCVTQSEEGDSFGQTTYRC